MGVKLALDVMIVLAPGLDDEPRPGMQHFQDRRLHLSPAVICGDACAGQPPLQQRLLLRRQSAEV